MATIFFARTGSDPNRADRGLQMPINSVVRALSSYESKYLANPPLINSEEKPSPCSEPTQTVLEIDADKACARFPKAGFYWFFSIRPKECAALLGMNI
jgi:hypothetical protein